MLCAILDRVKARLDGARYRTQISFVDDRPGHDFRYAIDPAKAERALGWSVQRALADGLNETVAWYLEHPTWLERPEAELKRLGLARNTGGT
jgi:dTDP-glucose 4,6-dehydratase